MSIEPLAPRPPVTVFMAVRNEATYLAQAVSSIATTTYPGTVSMVVAVGPSTDGTLDIAHDLARTHELTVVDNPHGGTPQGLNIALSHCTTDVVIRMDGHAELPPDYITQAVDALSRTGAANVGGRMLPQGVNPFTNAVAAAMKSRWGVGGAGHRVGGNEGPAESVYLGSFRKSAVDHVGGYDEHFVRAQDWELNHRLTTAGFQVWYEPTMVVPYRPRTTLAAVARQFHQSGRWRREVGRRHPGTLGWRYLIPPTVVVALAGGLIAGVVGLVSPWLILAVAWAIPAAYVLGVLAASASLIRVAGWRAAAYLPVVLITMHMAWGTGFLRGLR